jgi:peptidoglycan/LPS O-acetylase OafA/YrhL
VLLALALWYLSSVIPGFRGPSPNASFLQVSLHLGYLNGIFGYPWLNPVFWTLAIEFQFYLLVSIAFGLISSRSTPVLALMNCALLALPFIVRSNVLVFHYLGLFLFGIAAFQFRAGLIGRETLMLFMLGSGISVWITHDQLTALIGLATSALILANVNLGMKPLLMLGAISYSLYLVHVPIGGRVVNFGKRYIESQSGEAILSIAGVLVSILTAYVFYRLIEMPTQELASKFRYSN